MEEEKVKIKETIIEIEEPGPVRITGNIILKDLKRGSETSTDEVWLCKCGKSKNKPFCDESHLL